MVDSGLYTKTSFTVSNVSPHLNLELVAILATSVSVDFSLVFQGREVDFVLVRLLGERQSGYNILASSSNEVFCISCSRLAKCSCVATRHQIYFMTTLVNIMVAFLFSGKEISIGKVGVAGTSREVIF
jgi:hypothetical protein